MTDLPDVTMPASKLTDLNTLTADAALAHAVKAQFVAWLETPEHQPRQQRGALFGRRGTCCALGGLALVLRDAGLASVNEEKMHAAFNIGGTVHGGWWSFLPGTVALALDLNLSWISDLNDRGQSFAQIARQVRNTPRHEQHGPF